MFGNSTVTAERCLTGFVLIKPVPRLRLGETSAIQRGQKVSSCPSAILFIRSPSEEVWESAQFPSLSLSISLSLLPYPYFMKSSEGMKLSETNPLLDI